MLLLVGLQAVVFNHVHFFGYATPMPYVYLLLILPSTTPRWAFLLIGFLLGLTCDLFTNTPGMAAAATTALAFVLPPMLRLFVPRDFDEDAMLLPSVSTMEWWPFMRYALFAVLLHHALFFILESFTFFRPLSLLLDTLGSTLLTLLLIAIFEALGSAKPAKS
ncbi:MAG: rod shape-determining protein MreD [Alloprevotella sp.]|nr:rod shape-determining protein MreD [Alloprevotella sp.]MBR6339745.1 rod shape-determining protein MreD [Alloprevotella sp.]